MRHSRTLLIAAILTTVSALTLNSCGNAEPAKTQEVHEHTDDEEHLHTADYQCPMQCEGDKTYSEKGKCPKCKMDLDKVAEQHDHEGHDH